MGTIQLGDVSIELTRKKIKNINFRVDRSTGQVRMSAPRRMSRAAVMAVAASRLGWIRRQLAKGAVLPRSEASRYVDGERHWVWGEECVLVVSEWDRPPRIQLDGGILRLGVRPGADLEKRRAVVEKWYREQIHTAVEPLLERWQPKLGIEVEKVYVRRMTSRWGSCNVRARTIRLNTELARRRPECLEYVVVHELVHLLEPSHNRRFYRLMDGFLPDWKELRAELRSGG